MTWKLDGTDRNISDIKVKTPRKIQEEAIQKVTETCKTSGKLLLNMPCRTGKTFTTLYGAYQAGIELVIVLCGKASAKSSYKTDSVWKDLSGNICGFNHTIVSNKALNNFFSNPALANDETAVIELTPQLLNKHPEYTTVLQTLAKAKKTLFAFDEAHFTERTEKTQKMVATITDSNDLKEASPDEMLAEIGTSIPWVYITASPDTVSLQNQFSVDQDNYYEVTKEYEWELYIEDLKKPVDQREFNYVPVRNCLYVMNRLMDSIYNSATSTKQDYTSLFVQRTARSAAKKFVFKSLSKVIETINAGPEKSFMEEDATAPYSRRASNINLMVKVPVNSTKTNKTGKSIAENLDEIIRSVEAEILNKYPEFTAINILDVTLSNNIGQAAANEFFDANPDSINIILTQQRLIEGTTLYNLDGFLYYCSSGSLVKYKQESGRTLTPAKNKRFGFIFFFDEDALAHVKAVLAAKIRKLKGKKKGGPRKLSEHEAKKLTRINPAFIIDGNDDMKLIDYSQSLYSKSDLERTRTRESLFDKEQLLKIPGLIDLISGLLTKMSNNTTRKTKTTSEADPNPDAGNTTTKSNTNKKTVTSETPAEEIEIEKFVHSIIYTYQDCVKADIDCTVCSELVKVAAEVNALSSKACSMLYDNEYTYSILMEILEVLLTDQENINPEEDND